MCDSYSVVASSFGAVAESISFDWLTFSGRSLDPAHYATLLGLSLGDFEHVDRYMNGYAHRYTLDGISILYGGHDDCMGCCVNMSGTGCRAFEERSSLSWTDLFALLMSSDAFNVTRLDVAFDDRAGRLDMDIMRSYVDRGFFVSRTRNWSVTYGSSGSTLYFGSRKSAFMLRIYDKAAERCVDGHWIRVEMQLRDSNASGFLSKLVFDSVPIGELFSGVLLNYVRFVDPSSADSNRSRWQVASWWRFLTDFIRRIKIASRRGVEVSIDRVVDYVVRQAGNAIFTVLRCLGATYFYHLISSRHNDCANFPSKYQAIIDEFSCG